MKLFGREIIGFILKKDEKKEDKFKKRMELWKKGYTDKEIGKELNISKTSITNWRRSRNLECNHKRTNKKEFPERMKLYNKGLNDKDIERKLGIRSSIIAKWRRDNNLVSNVTKREKQKELYNRGIKSNEEELKDEILGVIKNWRKRIN